MASNLASNLAPPGATNLLESVTLRWSNLADRRFAYFVELYQSNRWRHYYDENEFLARIREVKLAATEWDRLARECSGAGACG